MWLVSIIPSILLMIITAGIIAYVFFKRNERGPTEVEAAKKAEAIFSLAPALKFAGLLVVIKIFTKVCLIVFGQSGFIISSIIASFAGIDAIIVNLAEMAGKTITFQFAFATFIIINTTNLISKSVYSYLQGDKKFAWKFLLSVLLIALAGASWLIFI